MITRIRVTFDPRPLLADQAATEVTSLVSGEM